MFVVNLGAHRGNPYMNSGDNHHIQILPHLLPDGTIVTIRRKHPNYSWVTLHEGLEYSWYPMDLLTPINKSSHILRLLECLK